MGMVACGISSMRRKAFAARRARMSIKPLKGRGWAGGPYITMGDGAHRPPVPSCDTQTHETYPPAAQICHYGTPTGLKVMPNRFSTMLNELDGPPTRR